VTSYVTVPKVRFKVRITRDEAGYWVAECVSLPGCVTQGTTKTETLDNLQEAIAGWLETAQAHPEIWEAGYR